MIGREGLLRAAGIVAAVSIMSKLLGFAREASLAAVFGATYAADAYLVGQTVPTVVLAALSAALGSTFIPVFSGVRQTRGREAAFRTVSSVVNATVLVSAAFILVGELLASPLTRIVAPGFQGQVHALTLDMTRIMFPMVLFQSLSGLLAGLLQADDNFAVPAVAGLAFNVVIIASILTLGPVFGIRAVAAGTVVAVAAQVALKVPALLRTGYRWQPILDLGDPGLRRMGALIGPVLIATVAGQMSIVVNRVLASGLPEGSIAALNYATRLMGLVPGVVGFAIVTVIYPTLARLSAARDWSRYSRAFSESMGIVSFVLVPVAVGMAVLRVPAVRLVFERGAFDAHATAATAWALLFLAPSAAIATLHDMANRAFYALQDTTTPMIVSVGTAGINIVLNLVLVHPLAHGGLALATTLSGAFAAGTLLWLLRGRLARTIGALAFAPAPVPAPAPYPAPIPIPASRSPRGSVGGLGATAILDSLWRVVFASAAMGVMVRVTHGALDARLPGGSLFPQAIRLLAPVSAGVLSYGALVLLLRVPEARLVLDTARRALRGGVARLRSWRRAPEQT